ncbi:hypothetical protein [Rubrivirga sp.]|uniref:hypothetical protein n=1 Tax=Rubrivirga sp. TaxID=1885344 RepID=UPI003B528F40
MPSPTDDEIRQRYGLPPGTRIVRSRGPVGERVRLDPDSFHYRVIESELVWAAWDRPVAVAGQTARLTVQGVAVGEGAPVRADVTDARGRRVARAEALMYRDAVVVDVPIPRQTEGVAVAVARIDDLGLEVTSGPLVVLPWIELSPRWERDGRPAEVATPDEPVTLVVGVDARRDLLPKLEGAAVRLAVRVGELSEPVVELRGVVRDREVRVDWRAVLPGARLDIARQALLDRAADRAGAPRGEPPYRYERPALSFAADLHGVVAVSPPLPVAEPVTLSVVNLAAGGGPAAGREVTLEWPDGSTETQSLDAHGRLALDDVLPGPVEVALQPADGEPAEEPSPPPDDADAVLDVPVQPGRGYAALVPTGQHTHLRLLPFILSP